MLLVLFWSDKKAPFADCVTQCLNYKIFTTCFLFATKVGKMFLLLSIWWSRSIVIYLSIHPYLFSPSQYHICKKNPHDVYKLINPNITSFHLQRNPKLVWVRVLHAQIFYMESVFISRFDFMSVSCNSPYNNHLVSFAIFFRFIFIRIIFRAILIYKRLSSVCQTKKILNYIIRECSVHNFLYWTENITLLRFTES